MLNFSTLLAGNDLWTILINFFAKWIVNYGWAIVVFTIILKLVLSPLDILQRVSSQKQTRVMNALQPEVAALEKKYGNDKERLSQETNKLYKKHNAGVGGSCLIMLLTMVLNIVIVFTLFGTVRTYGSNKLYESYRQLDETYVSSYNQAISESKTEEEAQTFAVEVTKQRYEELKKHNSWLWVKNVWKSDTKTSQFVDFNDYAKHEKLVDNEEEGTFARTEAEARYKIITTAIDGEKPQPNGYYGLIVLAVVVSFLTQFLSAKLLQPKGQKMGMSNIIMSAIIPITMLILAINSNVVYILYIITNSVMSAIISTTISLIMRHNDKKHSGNEQLLLKKKNVEVVEYSRNYKK